MIEIIYKNSGGNARKILKIGINHGKVLRQFLINLRKYFEEKIQRKMKTVAKKMYEILS